MVRNEENKKTKFVDRNHKLLGKHAIPLTVPLTLRMPQKAERFNSMPSNPDHEMVAVKLVSKHKSKEKKHMVVRKLGKGDSIDFIDYPKE